MGGYIIYFDFFVPKPGSKMVIYYDKAMQMETLEHEIAINDENLKRQEVHIGESKKKENHHFNLYFAGRSNPVQVYGSQVH